MTNHLVQLGNLPHKTQFLTGLKPTSLAILDRPIPDDFGQALTPLPSQMAELRRDLEQVRALLNPAESHKILQVYTYFRAGLGRGFDRSMSEQQADLNIQFFIEGMQRFPAILLDIARVRVAQNAQFIPTPKTLWAAIEPELEAIHGMIRKLEISIFKGELAQ
jgi:hypothetical protein